MMMQSNWRAPWQFCLTAEGVKEVMKVRSRREWWIGRLTRGTPHSEDYEIAFKHRAWAKDNGWGSSYDSEIVHVREVKECTRGCYVIYYAGRPIDVTESIDAVSLIISMKPREWDRSKFQIVEMEEV